MLNRLYIVFLAFLLSCNENQTLEKTTKNAKKVEKIPIDLSTKEGVFEAYHIKTNKKADKSKLDDFCEKRNDELTGVILVGWFADNRGCMWQGMFVNESYGSIKELRQEALQLNGWEDKEQRVKLALLWTKIVYLDNRFLQMSKSATFDKPDAPAFNEPTMTLQPNGDVVITGWISSPGGMLPKTGWSLSDITFSSDAATITEKTHVSFVESY